MANYNTTANVVLSVNGKQAQQVLANLQRDAQALQRKIAQCAVAGDKATMRKLQKELSATNRLMDQLRGSTATAEKVLSQLDKATPRELQRTLRTLQTQLNGIERGSAAWDAHCEKIKAVKAEIKKVNQAVQEQESAWERINRKFNDWQTAIMAGAAAFTGLVMAGKSAVQTYADMDSEMANVRKFTGMSAEEVATLNEEFKKMDTRTSREDLNRLAEEAGRLGKTSQEDVLGFVKAADKINVALDDLGDGATLTLSKLTNIFGDEARLGTEQSLLAVGSVINELSQNCTASAPYLANFAQRMAGVGAQAKMTVPQILAFAAVLDSQGQAVEMSATAVSQLILKMMKEPAKIAQAAGLEVQQFTEMLKTDTNDAIMTLLQSLHDLGDLNALAPTFADMGVDGARASQVIAALAGNIDTLKWQQSEANKAFEEATSVTNEYNVQNNTVQAGLDKARKRFTEIAVELGEKLMPVMRYCLSSASLMMRALATLVDVFIKYRTEIIAVTAAFVAYKIAVNASNIAFKVHYAWLVVSKTAAAANKGTVAALHSAHLLLQLGLAKLQGNWAKQSWLMTELKSQGAALASGWGALAAVAVLLGTAIYNVYHHFKKQREETERQRKELAEYRKSLYDISSASASYASEEITRLDALYKAATNEKLSRDERLKAVKQMQELYPDVFRDLSSEVIMVGDARKQYDELRNSIIRVARARAAADKIEENTKTLMELEDKEKEQQIVYDKKSKKYLSEKKKLDKASEAMNNMSPTRDQDFESNEERAYIKASETTRKAYSEWSEANSNISLTKRKIKETKESIDKLAKEYGLSASDIANSTSAGDGNVPSTTTKTTTPSAGGSTGMSDKFADEKEWREREEASNRIAYVTGKKDYIAYTDAMNQIAVDFYAKQLEHTDLTATERLKIEADYYEAKKKQDEAASARSIDEENSSYAAQLAEARQFYIDGKYSKETYDNRIEELEIEHQRRLVSLYAEGTKERLQAEQQLQSLLISQMQRRQQKTEALERKYAQMKKEYFGDNPAERQLQYDADFVLLQVVYDREIKAAGDNADEKLRIEEAFEKAKAALRKKYALDAEEDVRNSMERAIDASTEWLNGDGGKAMAGALSTAVSGMSAAFSQLTSLVQSELDIQTAAIEKRYDAEIAAAEGNSYKVKKLEAQKEAEIAKAKNEANRKSFAMQVIQALAQTAQNALSAYGSAAAVPIIGYILAPIAAGMAVAAGMLQVAAIKKQQQASEAQGYSEGGFTPPGRKDEAVGVVHAGEWVASQRLVNHPQARPLLEALDYAQRTNTVGSLTAVDVSRSITAPIIIASQPQTSAAPNVVVNVPAQTSDNSKIEQTLSKLNERLNEPFVTVNTVTGDKGINQAQEEYTRLMRNKTPKSRK